MNILLAGGPCTLMNRLIIRCKKEGHRVFLLTGDRFRKGRLRAVRLSDFFRYGSL